MFGKSLSLLLMFLRIVLTLLGAVALLYTVSFSHSIIPNNPDWDYQEWTVRPEEYRPWLWVVPWLFMEVVSSLGPRRNIVWFSGLGTVLLATYFAWPVLSAHYPELVHPTFEFEDGKLASGFMWLGTFFLVSVLFRKVLLSFLFMKPHLREESDASYADAEVLDPTKARTVREIAADPVRVNPVFRFGEADMGLVERFRALMRGLSQMRAWRWSLLLLAVVLSVCWFCLYPQPSGYEAYCRDLARMYDLRGQRPRSAFPADFPASQDANVVWLATTPAVHAAYRVMSRIAEHESLANMKRPQAEKMLGLDRVSLPQGYREQLRDERDVSLPSVEDMFDSRTRFLTVTDGQRTAVLYVRFGEDDETISISEVQDAGWDAHADYVRRRYGADVTSRIMH